MRLNVNKKTESIDLQSLLTRVRDKREELEKRLNYKAQPLSREEQERLDTEFHNAQRTKRPID